MILRKLLQEHCVIETLTGGIIDADTKCIDQGSSGH